MTNNKHQQYEKLSTYAERMGIAYRTAWRQYNEGKLPQVKRINGRLYMPVESELERPMDRAALYSRVSSSENKPNLERQAQRLYDFATAKGLRVTKNISECASGLNEKRPKLWKLLKDDSWDILVVEHKDRLTRFGFSFIEGMLQEQGREVLVVNEAGEKDKEKELVEDLVSIITSFTARIYGQRRSKRKTEKIIAELTEDAEV